MGYLDVNSETNINKPLIAKIYDFYLFHCPVERLIQKGIPLSGYGWNTKIQKNQLRNRAQQLFEEFIPKKNRDEVFNYIEENFINNHNQVEIPNSIALFTNNLDNHLESVLSHIRNSLAHGRFNIYLNTNNQRLTRFEFEDIDTKNNNVTTAIISMKANQLLKMIEIIQNGPS